MLKPVEQQIPLIHGNLLDCVASNEGSKAGNILISALETAREESAGSANAVALRGEALSGWRKIVLFEMTSSKTLIFER